MPDSVAISGVAHPSPSGYDDNVFLNCPFDDQYRDIFNALIFSIHDLGFVARCGLEAIGSEKTRLTKLIEIIGECKYGIHDISRIESRRGLPRFNMPFECGLFWGCQSFGDDQHSQKRILVLDSEQYRYQKTLSDIAGQDIQAHDNRPEIAVNCVRSWLASASGRANIPGGKAIWDHYKLFKQDLPALLTAARITPREVKKPEYFGNYVNLAVEWLEKQEAANR